MVEKIAIKQRFNRRRLHTQIKGWIEERVNNVNNFKPGEAKAWFSEEL